MKVKVVKIMKNLPTEAKEAAEKTKRRNPKDDQ